MARWLFKQEPSEYSFTELERDGETIWDGVASALALRHLRAVRAGDEILFYHTGKEKAVVGLMRAAADAEERAGAVVVRVKPLRRLHRPVSLAEIKAEPACGDWELTRHSRLSIMPVPKPIWDWLLQTSAAERVPTRRKAAARSSPPSARNRPLASPRSRK